MSGDAQESHVISLCIQTLKLRNDAGWLEELRPPSIDGWALELLDARQVLPLLAAVLHVPALYAAALDQTGSMQGQAAALQAQFSQPLVTGLNLNMSCIASPARGLLIFDLSRFFEKAGPNHANFHRVELY